MVEIQRFFVHIWSKIKLIAIFQKIFSTNKMAALRPPHALIDKFYYTKYRRYFSINLSEKSSPVENTSKLNVAIFESAPWLSLP